MNSYVDLIKEVAADYKAKGYDVTVEPGSGARPEFLGDFQPDLIAKGPHESVVVEVKAGNSTTHPSLGRIAELVNGQDGWRFELVVKTTHPDQEVSLPNATILDSKQVRDRLAISADLAATHHPQEALLLSWTAFEAAMRQASAKEGLSLQNASPANLVGSLYSNGILDREDYDFLLETIRQRNSIVHGFEISVSASTSIARLQLIAKRLMPKSLVTQHS